jgi:superfamily II DNA/RNA helicase
MSFSDLGLAPELLQAIADQGYTEPTPVQAKAIPAILQGQDVMAAAQTGTGKNGRFHAPDVAAADGIRQHQRFTRASSCACVDPDADA